MLQCLDLINYISECLSYLNEQTTPSQTNFLCKYHCLSKLPCLSAKSACMTNCPTIWDDKPKARRCVWVKHLLNTVLETWMCQWLFWPCRHAHRQSSSCCSGHCCHRKRFKRENVAAGRTFQKKECWLFMSWKKDCMILNFIQSVCSW